MGEGSKRHWKGALALTGLLALLGACDDDDGTQQDESSIMGDVDGDDVVGGHQRRR
jgi:hypothetical protein